MYPPLSIIRSVFLRRHADDLFELSTEVLCRPKTCAYCDINSGLIGLAEEFTRFRDPALIDLRINGHAKMRLE
jgi:hypothetical protein